MKSKEMVLSGYLPEASVNDILELLDKYPCNLKIVSNRKSKHGDFKKLGFGHYQVTINNDLNKYRFLITLVHEIAHLVTYKQKASARPHGTEWKLNFQKLMLTFLRPEIFPPQVLAALANYLRNPKACTDTDIQLSLALKYCDDNKVGNFIFELPENSRFSYNERVYIKGEKRRTRFACREINTKRQYLFHHNALVLFLENH
ncbi:MAG: SprT-like domain-containing protein [Flavobacteriaceae bacterium]|nr:SprT-like domain-containing protein [Flavobacteriaceae bacterium]